MVMSIEVGERHGSDDEQEYDSLTPWGEESSHYAPEDWDSLIDDLKVALESLHDRAAGWMRPQEVRVELFYTTWSKVLDEVMKNGLQTYTKAHIVNLTKKVWSNSLSDYLRSPRSRNLSLDEQYAAFEEDTEESFVERLADPNWRLDIEQVETRSDTPKVDSAEFILILRQAQGFSSKELAAEHRINHGTMRKRQQRAREVLQADPRVIRWKADYDERH